YWARALLIAIFGSNLWTVRIGSAVLGLATVLATCRLARSLPGGGERTAFLAGAIQLTTFQFVYLHSARTGELETALSFAFVLAAHLFLRATAVAPGSSGFLLHHLCLVLILNLKLPVAAIPIGAELAAFALLPATKRHFGRWLRAGAVILPLGLVWHGAQVFLLGAVAWEVVTTMAGQASGAIATGTGGRAANLVFYAGVIGFGAYPYAFAYPVAIAAVLKQRWGQPGAREWQILGLFAAAVIVFYLGVAKAAPWYVIPVYPFLSLFLARWLADLRERDAGRVELGAAAGVVALILFSGVNAAGFNPFATTAIHIPMSLEWRQLAGVSPAAGVIGAAVVTAAGLLGLRRALGPRLRVGLALVLAALLIGTAGVRVALPLVNLGHQSAMARLHRSLAESRAAGLPLFFPIDVPGGSAYLVRYYFADEFEIRIAPGGARSVFQLVRERND
ncbi:MAG: glycosyltransferase family 39 protein, partial [Proteobacteria bacterium]|nr:glycosyltransferase family 39 protein [Pseudomonadota bacterium]